MGGKTTLTDEKSATVAAIPNPILGILVAAIHTGDEEAIHDEPFLRW
jgi:hypothetical protein